MSNLITNSSAQYDNFDFGKFGALLNIRLLKYSVSVARYFLAHQVSLYFTHDLVSVWHLSMVHHFQRSALKPLGKSKSNFMWSLHGKGKVYINGGHMTKMAMPLIW